MLIKDLSEAKLHRGRKYPLGPASQSPLAGVVAEDFPAAVWQPEPLMKPPDVWQHPKAEKLSGVLPWWNQRHYPLLKGWLRSPHN
jgi:hypothetical protein